MTVEKLREALEGMDNKAEVLFGYDYGDYNHTVVFDEIRSVESINYLEYHNYLRMMVDSEKPGKKMYVVLT